MQALRFAGTLVLAGLCLPGAGPNGGEQPRSHQIHWHTDLETARLTARATNRPMLIVFDAEWCGHCRRLHATTLAEPKMAEHIGRRFVPVRLKLEDNRRAAEILGIRSLPTSIVLTPQADLLGRIIGYVDAHRYYALLESSRRLHRRLDAAEAAGAAPQTLEFRLRQVDR